MPHGSTPETRTPLVEAAKEVQDGVLERTDIGNAPTSPFKGWSFFAKPEITNK
jgi:hypothetical protein